MILVRTSTIDDSETSSPDPRHGYPATPTKSLHAMRQDLQRILAHFGHIDSTHRIQRQNELQIQMDLSLPQDAKTSDFSNRQRLMLV